MSSKTDYESYLTGVGEERERIIKLLEGFDDSCLWRQVGWSPDAYEGFNMQDLISLIKGEQDEDACEPSDSPCVNGWSCQKHRMTIEQLIDFLAEINGENK